MNKEFEKYARLDHRISSMTLSRYESVLNGYINPTILEERKLNVASMDVFSRLMNVLLSTLNNGFIQCVDAHVVSTTATENEINNINAMLNGGVYLE